MMIDAFKSLLVERESYLLELARYVVLNSVRAGMVRKPKQLVPNSRGGSRPPFLATDWLLSVFADTREEAVVGYRRFVADGIGAPSPWLELENQVYLGSEHFVERMQA